MMGCVTVHFRLSINIKYVILYVQLLITYSIMAQLGNLVILLFLNQIGKSHANGPCNSNYTTLDNVRRNVAYNKTTDLCDKDLIKNGTWYRFRSTAGDQILAQENSGIRSCGTYFPIWMEGTHPTVDDVITIVPVCVAIEESDVTVYDCNLVFGIKVVKCGSFFLYGLEPPDQCNASYCTTAATPAGKNTTTPFPTTSPITGPTLLGNTTTHSPTTSPITIAMMPGSNTTTPFATTSTTTKITANMTCDNRMIVYADGVQVGKSNYDYGWSKLFKFPATTKVFTIHGMNRDGSAGIIGSFSTGLVTDASWRCSNQLVCEWQSLNFDDSKWPSAVVFQKPPVFNGPKIASQAKWIWTSTSNDLNVYCRKVVARTPVENTTYPTHSPTTTLFPTTSATTSEITANMTCDDTMVVYADGIQVGKDNNIYETSQLYKFPATTKVFAIHGINRDGPAGIIGSFSTGLVTDATWRCSNQLECEWQSLNFDDSKWPSAVVVQSNITLNGPKIASQAKWIWTSTFDDWNVYCRKVVVPNKPTNLIVTNIRAGSAEISWVNPNNTGDGNLTGVWIKIKKDNSLILNTTMSKVNTYKLVSLTPNTTYEISVSAGNKHGFGKDIIVSFTTLETSTTTPFPTTSPTIIDTTPVGNTTTHSPTTSPITTAKTPGKNMTTPSPTTLPATTDPNTRTDGILDELDRQVDDLYHQNISVQKKVANQVIDHLLNVTNLNADAKQGENKLNPQNITTITKILQQIVGLNISDDNLNILGPASNILDIRNAESWENMTDNKVIRDLVVTLENYGFQYGENLKNSSNTSLIVIKYPNVQLKLRYIKNPRRLSQRKKLFKFPNSSFELSPDALPKKSGAVVVILWYKTLNSLIQNTSYGDDVNAGISREIITVNVRPPGKIKFSDPIRITWDYEELNGSKICVYWKPRLDENRWETDGCKKIKDKLRPNRLICECDHLTAFAVMDISGTKLKKGAIKALEIISTIGCAVSLVGVILTILVYALLWKRIHRNSKTTVPSQVLMHLCVAIGMTDIFAILAGPALKYEKFCIAVSVLLYFFVLALFGWMLCEGIIIYFQLVKVFSGLSLGGKHLKRFYVVGWGIPVIVVAVLVGANDRKDFITESACWCAGDSVLFWVFVATLGLILSINVVIFVLALRNSLSIWQVNSACEEDSKTKKATICAKLKKAKIGLKGSAVLLPILGLTWVFGLLVFNLDTIAFKYLFAIFNSLQGLMIFIFHVLINKKIQEEIIRKRNARKVKESANNNMANPTYLTPLTLEDAAKSRSSMPNDIDHRKDSDHQMTTFSPPKVRVD